MQFLEDDGGARLELIHPLSETSPVARALKQGGGLNHICYRVEDLESSIQAMVANGAKVVREPLPAVAFDGRRVTFLYTRERELIEFVEAGTISPRTTSPCSRRPAIAQRTAHLPRLRWALLSNVTQEPLRPFLKQLCYDIGFDADVWVGGFDTALQDATAPECATADVVVVALRLQVLAPALVDRFVALTAARCRPKRSARSITCLRCAPLLRTQSKAVILVHGFETPVHPALGVLDYRSASGQVNTIRRLNLEHDRAAVERRTTFVIDLDAIRGRLAGDRFIDPRTWHIGRIPYTRTAMRAIAGEYLRVVRAAKGRNRKCLVVDADGTLWGGIVGDDGPDGVRIGRSFPGSAFYEFQQALLALRDRGILLALCSKNDRAAVDAVFETRAADMPLQPRTLRGDAGELDRQGAEHSRDCRRAQHRTRQPRLRGRQPSRDCAGQRVAAGRAHDPVA